MTIYSYGSFPEKRMRRIRYNKFSRDMVRENHLSPKDFIYPVFVLPGQNKEEDVPSMPGVKRQSLDLLLKTAEECLQPNGPKKSVRT